MIPRKENWPAAFASGKQLADEILLINRTKKEYRKCEPGATPSDRELLLSAAINIFWEYKISQEASAAARCITWEKLESYLSSKKNGLTWQGEETELARLLKAIRRLKNNEADSAFLIMWGAIERFLAMASQDAFWLNYPNPKQAILELRHTLVGMAQGEESGKEESSGNEPQPETGPGNGEAGAQGGISEAEPAAVPGEGRESGSPRCGAGEAGGGVQGGGGCLEAAPSPAQNGGEEPDRPAPEALGGNQCESSGGN